MISRAYQVIRRTYSEEEWLHGNRAELIAEARADARQHAPCKLLIYVKEKPRRKGRLVVEIICR